MIIGLAPMKLLQQLYRYLLEQLTKVCRTRRVTAGKLSPEETDLKLNVVGKIQTYFLTIQIDRTSPLLLQEINLNLEP
jgi:hypothetical protein